MKLETGEILECGPIMGRTIWIIERITKANAFLTKLEWSKDMVNEVGCMRRTVHKERVKIRESSGRPFLYKKGIGSFENRESKIKILP